MTDRLTTTTMALSDVLRDATGLVPSDGSVLVQSQPRTLARQIWTWLWPWQFVAALLVALSLRGVDLRWLAASIVLGWHKIWDKPVFAIADVSRHFSVVRPSPPVPHSRSSRSRHRGRLGTPVCRGLARCDNRSATLAPMDFVGSISRRLSSAEREALSNAVEQLDDFLVSELVELHDETKPKRTRLFSGQFLPSRYTDFYDFAMLRRLYVCLTVVAGRLQDQWEPPRCRGEELVLRAVLEHSETCLEEETNESTDAFADLRDRLFNDFDHEYLFDPAFDGIDDPTTDEGSQLGVHALHPSAWFTPFRPGSLVHPMLS